MYAIRSYYDNQKMKKSVWIICWLAVMACAEHIHWLGDYDTAHVKAKTEGKVLIVLLVNRNNFV